MNNAHVTVADDGRIYLVRLDGELDARELPQVTALLDSLTGTAAVEGPAHVALIIDLTGLTHLGAAGVGLLAKAVGRGADEGLPVSVAGASGCVLAVLEVTGLAKRYGADRTVEQALAEVTATQSDQVGVVDRYGGDRLREAAERAHDLLVEARAVEREQPRTAERLREEATLVALPYAERLAGRYRNRGEPTEDVVQVACLALVKAVKAYQPGLGPGFVAFATPTILGEIRRHFRDNTWRIRVPRRLQELEIRVRTATPVLMQALGRSPTDQDLARYLGMSVGEIVEAQATAAQYRPASLSQPVADTGDTLADLVGAADRDLESLGDRLVLRQLVAALPERDQLLLSLRFSGEFTQTQIAERLGVSQMQVSRLLRRLISRLRHELVEATQTAAA